jgi:hypothetical protein
MKEWKKRRFRTRGRKNLFSFIAKHYPQVPQYRQISTTVSGRSCFIWWGRYIDATETGRSPRQFWGGPLLFVPVEDSC